MEQRRAQAIHEALHATRGNIKEAADQLGIARSTFYRWLELYGRPNLGMGMYDPDAPLKGGLLQPEADEPENG